MAGADRVQAGREPNSRLGDSCLWRVRQCGSVAVWQSRVQSVRGESGSAGLALVGGGVGFSGFTSVGKVGGSVLCRSHLPRLPDPRSRGNYLPVRWRWRGVAGRGSERWRWEERVEVR